MICAAAPGKGVCQVSIYIDYYDLNVVTCSKASFRPAILLRESVKKSVENSTLGGGSGPLGLFSTLKINE